MPLRLPIVAALLLSACSTAGSYPSLLPRPGEKLDFAEPTVAPAPPLKPDPALDARIAQGRQQLAASATAFDAAMRDAERLVAEARGSAAGSDAWLNAQVALAELDAHRSDTSVAASDLEQIALDRAVAGEQDYPALDTVVSEAQALGNAQAARIAKLQAELPPG